MDPSVKTIGLCMIVRDEVHIIRRCLDSVAPLVDAVLIVDTGSTDGTQAAIRDFLAASGLPGEIVEEPWRDFAWNRSHALALFTASPRHAIGIASAKWIGTGANRRAIDS